MSDTFFKRQAAFGEMKQVNSPILVIRLPVDITRIDQLPEWPMKPLPRNAKNTNQIRHRQRSTASNEIHDAMMDPTE